MKITVTVTLVESCVCKAAEVLKSVAGVQLVLPSHSSNESEILMTV